MDILARAAQLRQDGQAFVLATVTWARGPSSGKGGAKAIIHPDGQVEGWLGGACATPTVVRVALQALGDGQARVLALGERDSRPGVTEVAMACDSEGAMEVFVEPMLPVPHLVIAGSSPMTHALATIATAVGWRAEIVSQAADLPQVVDQSYVVVATQGNFDEPALAAALGTEAVYVGLVASQKRTASVFAWLREQGVSDHELARVSAPAGVDLGATSHEEIAVSVMAGLVAFRATTQGITAPDIDLPELATDPVCGMSVKVDGAGFVSEHAGRQVYFCAAGCQRAFESDPAAYSPA